MKWFYLKNKGNTSNIESIVAYYYQGSLSSDGNKPHNPTQSLIGRAVGTDNVGLRTRHEYDNSILGLVGRKAKPPQILEIPTLVKSTIHPGRRRNPKAKEMRRKSQILLSVLPSLALICFPLCHSSDPLVSETWLHCSARISTFVPCFHTTLSKNSLVR